MTHEKLEGNRVTVIEPFNHQKPFNFRELYDFRDLLYQLIWRNITVRYKQTFLGFAWAVLNPVLTAMVFTLIFGIWARMPSGNIPYSLFFLAGFIPWAFFSTSLKSASNSLLQNRALLTKVYFPRVIAPLSVTATAFIDYLIACCVMVAAVLLHGEVPGPLSILTMLLSALWVWVAAFGLGLFFAAMNIRYRDASQIVPFITRVGMFASPVIYPVSMVPEDWHVLYSLNPVVGAIEWNRWGLFGGELPSQVFMLSALTSLCLLVSGAYYFQRVQATYADMA